MLLKEDIRLVDALMDVKAKIQDRIDAVEQLDRHRSAWVRILEDVSSNVPEFVWLNHFKEIPPEPPKPVEAKGDAKKAPPPEPQEPAQRMVELRGYAFTLNALAATMIRMMRSDYFDNVELIESRDTLYAGEKAYKFELAADVHYLSDEELRNLAAKSKAESGDGTSHASLN
jgi:Tfp pilus assembly protein PilN